MTDNTVYALDKDAQNEREVIRPIGPLGPPAQVIARLDRDVWVNFPIPESCAHMCEFHFSSSIQS